MNGKLLAVLRQDIDAFEEKIYEFTNGEIDRKAYKGFSGGFGSYAQRENGYSRRAADEGTAWVYSRMCRKIQRTAYEAHHMPDHPDARPPAAECGGDHEAGA